MDADTQAALDRLGERIEELAKLHAEGAPAAKIEAKEEQVEQAAERAGLSDEDADKLADRISAKLAASNDPDAVAEKVAARLEQWADEEEPGAEELETVAGRKPDEPKAEETKGDEPGEDNKDEPGDGDTTPEPPAHWFDRELGGIFG